MPLDARRLEEAQQRRAAATRAIVESRADKKLVVAGPGTGKTFTFKEALRACGGKGLALTFIRNLVAELKEALGELAGVFTFHGFCKHQMHRNPVEGLQENWDYYPSLLEILTSDLRLLGRAEITQKEVEGCLHDLDDTRKIIRDALALGNYYNAVSHTDLVYRVLRHFEGDRDKIPEYPLIVVDEYQDFSRLETSFIALLAAKGPVLIAGDDDQALYAFKNASARYIRELASDDEYEKFELPYCSRCTAVIVDAVNASITAATDNGNLTDRLAKTFMCYLPDKLADSEAHPKIIHAHCTVERKNARYIGRYVARHIAQIPIEDVRESREKNYSTVLVIGPNPFLKNAHAVLQERFPQAELKVSARTDIQLLDGYRRLADDEDSRLGWRIIIYCDPFEDADEALAQALREEDELHDLFPAKYRDRHLRMARLVRHLRNGEELDAEGQAKLCRAVGLSIQEIKEALSIAQEDAEENRDQDEVDPDQPTIICTSLVGAKGLSAAYVYIVGFNDEHFPRDPNGITDEEVCCFLVGLSRTRKECHVVSCGRLGNVPLRASRFGLWIRPYCQRLTVDAAYFRTG